MEENKVGLSAPWYEYQRKLKAFFEFDQEVEVDEVFIEEDGDIHIPIRVLSHKKFLGLQNILVDYVMFGDVGVSVDLYDVENDEIQDIKPTDFTDALKDNPIFCKLYKGTVHGSSIYFFAMDNEPVEFFNDDIGDYRGNYHGLYADIAKEIFYVPGGINFCTIAKQDK